MHLEQLARKNPWAVVGAAAIVGWVLGSGRLTLPGLGGLGGHATTAAAPAPAAKSTGIPAPAGQLATASASMAPAAGADDPFAGYAL